MGCSQVAFTMLSPVFVFGGGIMIEGFSKMNCLDKLFSDVSTRKCFNIMGWSQVAFTMLSPVFVFGSIMIKGFMKMNCPDKLFSDLSTSLCDFLVQKGQVITDDVSFYQLVALLMLILKFISLLLCIAKMAQSTFLAIQKGAGLTQLCSFW